MTNKEILAELKECYEYLYDIQENHEHEQMSRENESQINDAMRQLSKVYSEVFERTVEENVENIALPKKYQGDSENSCTDYVIPNSIYYYVSFRYKATGEITESFVTPSELDEYVWYKDHDFIAYEDYIGEN